MRGRVVRLSLRGSSMALSAVLAVLIVFFASANPSAASASRTLPSAAAWSVMTYDLAMAPCETHARSRVGETGSAAKPVEGSPSVRSRALHVDRLRDGFPDLLHTYYVLPQGAEGSASSAGVLVHNCNVNLPAWKKVDIDMDHIASGHMAGGARTSGGTKDLFPSSMSLKQVEKAVRNAYKNAKRIRTQDERVLVRGKDGRLTIEIWVNTKTRQIETAYPVNR